MPVPLATAVKSSATNHAALGFATDHVPPLLLQEMGDDGLMADAMPGSWSRLVRLRLDHAGLMEMDP